VLLLRNFSEREGHARDAANVVQQSPRSLCIEILRHILESAPIALARATSVQISMTPCRKAASLISSSSGKRRTISASFRVMAINSPYMLLSADELGLLELEASFA
jgi:hypothetical protein